MSKRYCRFTMFRPLPISPVLSGHPVPLWETSLSLAGLWTRGQGHIMANPVEESSCFAMLVYKNGALSRERVRDEVCASRSPVPWHPSKG